MGDGHRHRADHLHRRRRPERLRPLAADRQAARQLRSHPAVARQRADGQGDDRRGRPRPVRRRPAQGPRGCPRRRGDGVQCRPAGFRAAGARQDAVRLLRPRRDRARPARPGRCLPLHRARRLPPRRDGAAHGHAARCLGGGAGQRAGDADREAPGRQRVHPLQPGPAGGRCAAPAGRPAEILAPRPLDGLRPRRSQGAAGRQRGILGRGFRAREAQGRALVEPADRAAGPGQHLRRAGRLPLRRPGQRAHRRGRHAHHRRCAALPRFRALQFRRPGRPQGFRAAVPDA